jgi:threonine synthase
MKYISTRGGDSASGFREVVLKGLASDGGLFVPENYPRLNIEKLRGLSYAELAFEVINPFIDGDIEPKDLKKILTEVYSEKTFAHVDIAPLKDLGQGQYILELFHGPTLAFKDFALQFLGRLFKHFGEKINILGATSGDTGSAAIAGCAGIENVNIFILHPHGKVSEVQRKQMTTILAGNVHNIAVNGNFDDCQNIVKSIFEEAEFKRKYSLSAVNSINWARIVAQVVYYFYAGLKFDHPMSYSVPTGNFGDILAGWIALQMGLPVKKLIIATNKNDILDRFIKTGVYKKEQVYHTLSPSMDIQISSNFERLLFEYHSRNASLICSKIRELKDESEFNVDANVLKSIREIFDSNAADDEVTASTIENTYRSYAEIIDPHTATGIAAARAHSNIITLATAHPAKFPDAVKASTSIHPALPDFLSNLLVKEEKFVVANNSADEIKAMIAKAN